jgi:hypothetical protein
VLPGAKFAASISKAYTKNNDIPSLSLKRRQSENIPITFAGIASHHSCRLWFQKKYSHKLSDTSISSILQAEEYSHLADYGKKPDSKRRTPVRWPGLEIALFAWQKKIEKKLSLELTIIYGLRQQDSSYSWCSSRIFLYLNALLDC